MHALMHVMHLRKRLRPLRKLDKTQVKLSHRRSWWARGSSSAAGATCRCHRLQSAHECAQTPSAAQRSTTRPRHPYRLRMRPRCGGRCIRCILIRSVTHHVISEEQWGRACNTVQGHEALEYPSLQHAVSRANLAKENSHLKLHGLDARCSSGESFARQQSRDDGRCRRRRCCCCCCRCYPCCDLFRCCLLLRSRDRI